MYIAVDFDGTIVEHRYPEIGKERPFAVETLKRLINDRHRLILWSVREGKLLDDAVEWCRARGLEFYAVNKDFAIVCLIETGNKRAESGFTTTRWSHQSDSLTTLNLKVYTLDNLSITIVRELHIAKLNRVLQALELDGILLILNLILGINNSEDTLTCCHTLVDIGKLVDK